MKQHLQIFYQSYIGRLIFFVSILIVFEPPISLADLGRETGLRVPRFVSLSSNNINVRAGPGMRYPIKWVFQRKNFPVKIIAESDTWRKIKDYQDVEGWVHQRMLSGRRWVVVVGETRVVREDPLANASGVARFEPGVLARLEECSNEWCLVNASSYVGWINKSEIWGVD